MVVYKRATTDEELKQILTLQRVNLKQELSRDDIRNEGFVSISHTFNTLKRMNIACPHIIAKVSDEVIGYALCMLNEFRNEVPSLIPMFNYMDGIIESKGLIDTKYLIMGQVCINKAYRKQGVFKGLYNFMKFELKPKFDAVITEVNVKNKRSSEAHKAIGFELLDVHKEGSENWELIIWKWE